MFKKEIYKVGSDSKLVSSAAYNRLKNLFAAVNATRRVTKVLLRGA